jgi:hypothetical protein
MEGNARRGRREARGVGAGVGVGGERGWVGVEERVGRLEERVARIEQLIMQMRSS